LKEAKAEEMKWIEDAIPLLVKDKLENASWAAFHAPNQSNSVDPTYFNDSTITIVSCNY